MTVLIDGSLQLEEVNWRQNLTMAQSGRSKLKQPNALFEFVIKEGEVSTLRGPSHHGNWYTLVGRREKRCRWTSLMKNYMHFTARWVCQIYPCESTSVPCPPPLHTAGEHTGAT